MSEILPQQVSQAMQSARDRFQHLAVGTGVSWERESLFAMQTLQENDYLLKVARKAPDSLRMSVLNVAQMGLTLNPAYQHAWLIPRDGVVKLDIGYRGLIHLATREGAIRWDADTSLQFRQEVLKPFLKTDVQAYLFSPVDAEISAIGAKSIPFSSFCRYRS